MNMYRIIILLGLAIILGACSPAQKQSTPEPSYAPEPYLEPEEVEEADSPSLYQKNRTQNLFEDYRASEVGDLIQVHIVEETEASSEADTEADRTSSMNLGAQELFGMEGDTIPGLGGADASVDASSVSEFEGEGSTSRSANVNATVSARVVRVLEGGVLQVEGSRDIKVNDENQVIVVRGLVRPRDVDTDNAVLSTQMADAQIEMYGEGILADRQKPGWGTRILDKVWPF